MSISSPYIAFALHHGVIHLCLDSLDAQSLAARSLCREVQLLAPRAQVVPGDLGQIQNFIICKGCEARFNLMGYRGYYAPKPNPGCSNQDQLTLF